MRVVGALVLVLASCSGASAPHDAGIADGAIPTCAQQGEGVCLAQSAPCNEANDYSCPVAGDVCCLIQP